VRLIEFGVETISAILQWTVILVGVALPVVLDADAVRRLRKSPVFDSRASWRKRAGYLGAASNTLVYALPIALLIHNVVTVHFWDSERFTAAFAALFVLSMALAVAAPRYVRPQLIIGVLIPFFLWLCVWASAGVL
jgi:hypothetical protein